MISKHFLFEDTRNDSAHTTLGKERVTGIFADTIVKGLNKLNEAGKVPTYDSMYDENMRLAVRRLYPQDFVLYSDKCYW